MFDPQDKLERQIESIRSVQMDDMVQGYAAEEYLDGAIEKIEQAIADIDQAEE